MIPMGDTASMSPDSAEGSPRNRANPFLKIIIPICAVTVLLVVLAWFALGIEMGDEKIGALSLGVTLALTLMATAIAVIELMDAKQDRRAEDLKMLSRSLSRFRFNYAEKLRPMYHEAYKDKGFDTKDDPLIAKNDWLPDRLVTLDSALDLTIAGDRDDRGGYGKVGGKYTAKDTDKLSPRRDLPFSYNARIYLGKNVFDNKIFVIDGISGKWDDGIGFKVVRSTYDKFFDTCELIAHLSAYYTDIEPRDDLCIELESYRERAVGIGVCTLTVIRMSQDEAYFLVHHRSDKVGEAPGTVSMVPAGSFAPTGEYDHGDPENPIGDEPSLYNNVFREFEEELLGLTEVEHPQFYRPILGKEVFDRERLYYLGMGFDPVTTKMEMVTMLVIDWTDKVEGMLFDLCEERTADLSKVRKIENPVARVEAFFNEVSSSEGERIDMLRFDEGTLMRMYGDRQSMPVFREALLQSLRLKLYDEFKKMGWSP